MSHKITWHNTTRVLVLNNDIAELQEMLDGLHREGFSVDGTIDTDAAAEMLKAQRYHVLLLDLMLHATNGLALARRLKAQYPDLVIVLMSDYMFSFSLLAKADTGASGFVPKPFRASDIASFLRTKMPKQPRKKTGEALAHSFARMTTSAPIYTAHVKYHT